MQAKKEQIRQEARKKRKNMPDVSCKIVEIIKKESVYQNAKNIMIYYPIQNEINLLSLCNDSRSFFLPKIIDNKIFVCPYNTPLKKGKFNIPEPDSDPITDLGILDLIFIPALAADKKGFRIGYGCGYYDRFLEHISDQTKKIVTVYNDLLYESLPFDQHDQKADYILTEKAFIVSSNIVAKIL